MDISMPDGGGLAAIAAVKAVRPKTRILVLTVHDEPATCAPRRRRAPSDTS